MQIHARSGAEAPIPECDVLYVSAASAEPLGVWLDALHCEGRLLFPLEPEGEGGQMLLVTRYSDQSYGARFICGVQFVSCIGTQNPHASSALAAAFKRGHFSAVRSLHRNDAPDESCWHAGRGWWLSYAALANQPCGSVEIAESNARTGDLEAKRSDLERYEKK